MKIFFAGCYSRPYCLQEMNVYLATPHSYPTILEDMKTYLAGITAGNFQDVWKQNVDSFDELVKVFDEMKVYCAIGEGAGTGVVYRDEETLKGETVQFYKPFILESFYYVEDWMKPYIRNWWNFLLDSGAFTFLQNAGTSVDWNDYLQRYADYINEMDIELFFELDIDSMIGLKKVEKLRDRLEELTNKKSIPVWHVSRGKKKWIEICKNYDYVAIGGIVAKEIQKKDFKVFHYLLKIAEENGAKVHGLGFTNVELLHTYKFYSVDSTAWVYGNRGGFLYRFNGRIFDKINVPKGKRMKSKETAIHNFNEWLKFQKYALKNL